jgi:hypothetical protein
MRHIVQVHIPEAIIRIMIKPEAILILTIHYQILIMGKRLLGSGLNEVG